MGEQCKEGFTLANFVSNACLFGCCQVLLPLAPGVESLWEPVQEQVEEAIDDIQSAIDDLQVGAHISFKADLDHRKFLCDRLEAKKPFCCAFLASGQRRNMFMAGIGASICHTAAMSAVIWVAQLWMMHCQEQMPGSSVITLCSSVQRSSALRSAAA